MNWTGSAIGLLGLSFLLSGAAYGAQDAAAPKALPLVQNGAAVSTIIVPEKLLHEQTAAAWLQKYIEKATGARLPIVPESRKPEGALISVGHTELAKSAGIGTDDLKYDGCKMTVRGQTLFLTGCDTAGLPGGTMGIDGGAAGTCRAVTKFLEDIVGVRWLLPTPEGEVVPRAKNIAAPADLNVSFSPAFAFAQGRFIYGTNNPAGIANNYRQAILIRTYGGHSFYDWVPAEKYFKDHPDYFYMDRNGKRSNSGNHLCTSNPVVRELFKKGLFEQFDKGYDCVELGQTDGYLRCRCPLCEVMDRYGDVEDGKLDIPANASTATVRDIQKDYPVERLFQPYKWLIDEAKKQYPDKKVLMLIYGPTRMPSKQIANFGDNAILEITGGDPDLIRMWKGRAAGFSTYIYWFDITVDDINAGMPPSRAAQTIRELQKLGCLGIYFGGGGEGNWGFMGPTYYVIGKLMGDPSLDERTLVKDYCDGLYGKASRRMQDFFEMALSRGHLAIGDSYTVEDRAVIRFPPKLLAALDETLSAAELEADSERSRNVLKMTRDELELMKRLVAASAAYRAWQTTPTPESWQGVRNSVMAFDQWRESVLRMDARFADSFYPGWGAFCNYLTSEGSVDRSYYASWPARRDAVLGKPLHGMEIGYQSPVRYPLMLNLDKPPALGEIKARRTAAAPKLDGRLDDPAWAQAEAGSISAYSPLQPNLTTRVRLLYDDANLYLGYECNEPLIEKLVARSTGRDGDVWRLDCVEFLLSPDRSRRRYCHYIIAPAADAMYDDRTGFKTADDQDATWNGPCDYAFSVDKEGKQWFLEARIPFTTLETAAPKPGTWWLGNFCRERYAQNNGVTGEPELFMWSQDETQGFCNPSAFGRIEFGN